MAKKKTNNTKKKQKEQKIEEKQVSNQYKEIAIDFVLVLVLFFTMTKMGIFGIVLNNIFTFILGNMYYIPLVLFFTYRIYKTFFKKSFYIPIKYLLGSIFLSIFVMMLPSYLDGSISSIPQYGTYLKSIINLTKEDCYLGNTGGLIGNLLYVLLTISVTRTGSLIVLIVLFVLSLVMLVPIKVVSLFFAYLSKANKKNKEKRIKKKQEKIQRTEEEKLALAAEMNSSYHEPITLKEDTVKPSEDADKNPSSIITLVEADKEKQFDKNINSESIPKVTRNKNYHLPKPVDKFLDPSTSKASSINKTSSKVKGEKVIQILRDFDIEAQLLNTYIGPSVTKFEIKPNSTVKVNKILNIQDNIKMELAAKDIRIEAPIPGRSAVGIEIPNVEPIPVKMIDLMKSIPVDRRNEELLFALGKDLMGVGIFCNLAKMPHLLIAGATGSGKSVCINTIITSFLLRTNPDDVKLVLVDPKRVEFTPYHDIPHLLWPVITDATMASNMLKKIVVIMQERYEAFASVGVRDINSFNEFVINHNQSTTNDEPKMSKLPFIVVIIDELADLMAIAKKDVELSIQRITQLARASGIHLIVATQRPSTDVITGLIKSNIPSRISFAVASSIDSRTILDSTGAERLLGNGDMLYYPQGENSPIRLQGVFVSDSEIRKITDFVKTQAKPEYEDSYFEFLTNMNGTTVANAANAETNDSLYDEVVEFVKQRQAASTSLLQRRFGIGYNRAARLIDTLEDRGIIGPSNGSKPREVYLKPDDE